MLRLERHSKGREVTIRLQGKGKLLNRTFLIALAIAVGIHAFGFILFHVQPFKIKHLETIFPPVAVNIDLGLITDGAVLANLENMTGASTPLLNIIPSRPTLPKIPTAPVNKQFLFERTTPKPVDPFLTQSPIPWEKEETVERKFEVLISGSLANRKVINTLEIEEKIPYAKFSVQVDDRLGRIVWHSLENGEVSEEGEKLLAALRFEKMRHGFLTEGTVELLP